jgi:hypothetical protein
MARYCLDKAAVLGSLPRAGTKQLKLNKMTIQAGYLLQVTSWENDADFYNTKSLDGLTKSQVQWRIAFLNALKEDDSFDDESVPYVDIAAKITNELGIECVIWNDNVPDYPNGLEDEDAQREYYCGLAYDMLGATEYGCGRRIVDSYSVYCIPDKLEDITSEF